MVQAGRHAGCWTFGITRTGHCVGLTAEQWQRLPAPERTQRLQAAASQLTAAGAHAVAECVADIGPLLEIFDQRLQAGKLPL